MAEIAVLLAIKKISIALAGEVLNLAKPMLAKKADIVMALPTSMELIKEELELIHAFLNQNGMKDCSDRVLDAWITQVRTLAYDIEDIVDQFIYVVDEHKVKGSWVFLKKIIKKPQFLFSLDEIATEVDKVKNKLKELPQRRDRWIQPTVGGVGIPVPNYASQQVYPPEHIHSIDEIDEDEPVGIDKNKKMLTKLLHSEDCALCYISVWGMGGLGKSTLVSHVYKREGHNFDCHAWISVSQSYKMDHILREMLRELYKNDDKTFDGAKLNMAELKAELKKFLDQKRYLIILDDVWTSADLLEFVKLFIDQGKQSRVVVTTRIDKVASIAGDDCKINLEPLNECDAWILFSRKAFWKTKNLICPLELKKWGDEIVKKCQGLPLALVAVGSLLSLGKKSEAEWKRVHDQLIWELHDNPDLNHVEKIINLSYKHLPQCLKNCFLYCAMFPEDYLVGRKKLIRLWIAEGLVEKRGTSSLEDVAEGYLIELVQRSMLQVVRRNSFGRIRIFCMHDLVRELAIFLCKKESFSSIYDESSGMIQGGVDPRRLSILRCNNNVGLDIDPSRLRTFLAFHTNLPSSLWFSFISFKSKYLAVLDLSGLTIDTIPYSIGEFFNLKYLCLNDTNVKSLPKSITKLRNLETLSLKRTQLLNLPHGFAKLKKLRHLIIWNFDRYESFCYAIGVESFKCLWNLEELQSLSYVRASRDLVENLRNLSQLRCLCITDVRNSYCAPLCSSLSKMHKLSKLEITASNEDEVLQLEVMTTPPPNLQKLELTGRLAEGTLECPMFSALGNTLLLLSLRWCHLTENPIPLLSRLSNLTSLNLRRAFSGQQLSFPAGCFQNVKHIALKDMLQVNQIYIGEGALVSLKILTLSGLKELKDVHGLEFLPSIEKAYFLYLHSAFRQNLDKYDQMGKLKHIPHIIFR